MEDARFAELISGIAHELRSPLTSIKGFSSTLVKRWDRFTDEQRFQFVETIQSDAERMARIVSEVVDLARLEANRLELHPQRTEISTVASRAIEQLADLPGAERITVEIDPGLHAWADPARLEVVMFNLVENGVKFSDSGPVRLSATESDGKFVLVVEDEGIGIDPAYLPELFNGPASSAQHASPSGSGLGLLLASRLVQAHGGTISVESRSPGGSIFTVTLPPEGLDGVG
jgi:signal transduction histidine kinase